MIDINLKVINCSKIRWEEKVNESEVIIYTNKHWTILVLLTYRRHNAGQIYMNNKQV